MASEATREETTIVDKQIVATHSDDEFMNRFNNLAEAIGKLLISLSAGTLVVSATFAQGCAPGHAPAEMKWLLQGGWLLHLLSILFGVLYLYSFLRFYNDPYHAKTVRAGSAIGRLPFAFGALQAVTFVLGLLLVAGFALFNI